MTAGNQVFILHHLCIDVFCAGVFDVLYNGLPSGHFSAANHIGGNQQLTGVTSGLVNFFRNFGTNGAGKSKKYML